jgi:hypothetical protein
VGKAAVLLVLGAIAIFLVTGKNLSGTSVDAYQNAMNYYNSNVVRNIAIAGANIGANYIFLNPPLVNGNPWWNGYTNAITYGGGSFRVTVDSTSSIDPITSSRRLTMKSTATYGDSTYTVTVIMRPSVFSKFAFYEGVSGAGSSAMWATGDSIFGPFHVEGTLKTTGSPYFGGPVTAKGKIDSTSNHSHPVFKAGKTTGVSVPINKDFSSLVNAAKNTNGGQTFTGGTAGTGDTLWLKFKGDSISYHRGRESTKDTTKLLATWCPNHAIVLTNSTGVLHVSGVVKGQYTVGSLDSNGTGRGKVSIDDNITYYNDPRTNPSSTDMLGIVAYQDIVIADNGMAAGGIFTVQASLFSYAGGWSIENMSTRRLGTLATYGGWIVNTLNASTTYPITNGLKLNIRYDNRFATSAPPFFPGTKMYEILAWYE